MTPTDDSRPSRNEIQLSAYIFSASAGMIGACLTVIGLFRVVLREEHGDSIADNLLSIDAAVFFASCFLAYLALRAESSVRRRRLERVADGVFLLALTIMVVVGGLIAYEFI